MNQLTKNNRLVFMVSATGEAASAKRSAQPRLPTHRYNRSRKSLPKRWFEYAQRSLTASLTLASEAEGWGWGLVGSVFCLRMGGVGVVFIFPSYPILCLNIVYTIRKCLRSLLRVLGNHREEHRASRATSRELYALSPRLSKFSGLAGFGHPPSA